MVRSKRFSGFGVVLVVLFALLAPTQSAQAKKLPTSSLQNAGRCSPGPLVDQTGNPVFPNAPLVSCNRSKKKLAAGTYLVMATAGWFLGLNETVFNPSSGRCQLRVNKRVVPGSETRFGSFEGLGETLYQRTIVSQGLVKLKSGKHSIIFRCAQNQGYLKLARSTVVAVRIG